MKKYLFWSLFIFLNFAFNVTTLSQCKPTQYLEVINPSFEGPTGPHITPAPWNTCGITPDTQPGSWGVGIPASEGSTYVGFVNGGASWQEGASQQLSGAMTAGVEYTFTVDLATTNSNQGGINPAPPHLVIHGANTLCGRTELLWTSPIITNLDWQTYTVTFTPTGNYNHVYFSIGLTSPMNSYILLDNITQMAPTMPTIEITSHENGDSVQCSVDIFGTLSLALADSVVLSGSFTGSPLHANVSGTNWNQTLQFNSGGSQIVYARLYYTDVGSGDEACSYDSVIVNSIAPTVNFGVQDHCLSSSSVFIDSSAGFSSNVIVSWSWDFGDGNTSTLQNPNHIYSTAGNYNVTLSVTDQSGCQTSLTKQLTVNPLPTAIIGTATAVCEDDAEPVVTFTGSLGTSDYTFTYTLNSGANQTISTTGSSTTSFTIPTATAGVHDYLLLNVLDISTGCSQSVGAPNNRAIITVNPKPDAVISGSTVVCQNDAQPFITFTGSNSTGSYSFVYTINGGPEQTVTSTGGNNFSTVSVPTNISGSFTYELVRVFDPVTGCVQLINEVQEVVVNPLPTASISGATVVCQNDVLLPKITFTGNGGTSEYTFRYSINGGAPQAITTSGSNSVTVDVPTSVATTYTYALISVTDVTTGCIQNQVGSAVVKINPTPTGLTSGSVEVCQDATAPVVTFTGSNSTGSYTFSYQINGGPIESITANGATSVGVSQATNIPDTFTYTLLSVHDPITMCSLTTNSITEIIVRPLPIAQISAPQQGCYFDTYLPEVDFTGQNGDNPYTFTYNINGGSPQIATSSSGATATLQHSTNALGTFVYTITHIKEGSLFGCEQNQSVSTLVTINNLPTVLAGDDFPVCEGEPIILTGAGAQTYAWDNGVVNAQPYTPTTIGSTTYTVIGTDHNGCSNTDQIVVTVIPIPVMDIIGQNLNGCQPLEPIFTNNSTGNLAKCTWYLGNGEVVNNCGTFSSIFPTAGCFDVTLEVETPEGCKNTLTLNNYVCVQSTPVASFTANPSELTSYNWESQMENTTIGATSYEWNFGDGSGSNLTHSPLHAFPNDEGGSYFITLVASTTFGCRDTATAVVNLKEDMLFFVPNTFTPDGDIHNNTFEPIFTTGYNPYKYTMVIYNRWGEKVFETNDTKVGWDGTYGYDGGLCQSGTYTWKIEVSARLSEERKTYTGTINLLK